MYHDPCHTPMKTYAPLAVVNELMGTTVTLNDRCCGESGTLATTRPDISTQVRFRKEEEMRKGADALRADGFAGDGQGADVVPVVPAGAVALRRRRVDRRPTTSWSRSRGTCSARTGWPTTSPRRTAAGSSACSSDVAARALFVL